MNMYLFHQVSMLMLKPLCLQLVAIASRLSATVTIDAEQPKCRKQHTDMIKQMQSHTISSMSVKAIWKKPHIKNITSNHLTSWIITRQFACVTQMMQND